jgi:hypothetical protein
VGPGVPYIGQEPTNRPLLDLKMVQFDCHTCVALTAARLIVLR